MATNNNMKKNCKKCRFVIWMNLWIIKTGCSSSFLQNKYAHTNTKIIRVFAPITGKKQYCLLETMLGRTPELKKNNNGYNSNQYITLIIFTLDSLVSDINVFDTIYHTCLLHRVEVNHCNSYASRKFAINHMVDY